MLDQGAISWEISNPTSVFLKSAQRPIVCFEIEQAGFLICRKHILYSGPAPLQATVLVS
jgi:hypothetical protein